MKIYFEIYGVQISKEKAHTEFLALLTLMNAVYKAQNKNQYEKEKSG